MTATSTPLPVSFSATLFHAFFPCSIFPSFSCLPFNTLSHSEKRFLVEKKVPVVVGIRVIRFQSRADIISVEQKRGGSQPYFPTPPLTRKSRSRLASCFSLSFLSVTSCRNCHPGNGPPVLNFWWRFFFLFLGSVTLFLRRGGNS